MKALKDWYWSRSEGGTSTHTLDQTNINLKQAFEAAIDKRIREFIVIPEDDDGKT